MASHKSPPRRLFEMLEEQQDPFFLDIHLLDNGYSETRMQAKAAFLCWMPNNQCVRRRRGGALRCLATKLGCWEVMRRALNWKQRDQHCKRSRLFDCLHELRSKSYVATGFRRLSSSAASAEGGELDGDNGWKDIEQLSPLSVLDLHSDDGSSFHNHSMVEEEENTLISSSLNSPTEDGATLDFTSFPLHKEAKREVPSPSQEKSGDEMEENDYCSWKNQLVDLALINNLICLDFHESGKKWSQFRDQRREIGMQIESFILEELREECVLDMLDSRCTFARC